MPEVLSDSIKIAWNPYAVDGLIKNGISFKTISDLQNKKSRIEDLESDLDNYLNWGILLDKYINKNCEQIRNLKIRPTLNKLHNMRLLFSEYFSQIDHLEIIKQNFNPKKIYYYDYDNSPLNKIISHIKKSSQWNVEFVSLQASWDYRSLKLNNSSIPFWFSRDSIIKKIVKALFRYSKFGLSSILETFSGLRFAKNKSKYILILNTGWSTIRVFKELKKQGNYKFIFWESVIINKKNDINYNINSIFNEFKDDKKSHNYTTRYGIDFFDLFLPIIKDSFENELPEYILSVKKFLKLNNKFKFQMVSSINRLTESNALFDQCFYLHIPALVFDHGVPFGFFNTSASEGLTLYGTIKKSPPLLFNMVYGKHSVNYLKKTKNSNLLERSQEIAIGSPYFSNLLLKNKHFVHKPDGVMNICYVFGGILDFHGSYNKDGLNNPASLYRLRYKFIEKIKNNQKFLINCKLGFNSEKFDFLIEKSIDKGRWSNIIATSSSEKLINIFSNVDLFIIDQFSTPFFEVLTTSLPVIAILDSNSAILNTISNKARQLLDKRVTIVSNEMEFLNCIDDLIDNQYNSKIFNEKNHNDSTFINEYTTLDNFSSADSSIESIERIINYKSNNLG